MPPYTTYLLCHAGTELLRCDASTTPAFTLGEVLTLGSPDTGETLGPFTVERITRQIMYRTKQQEPLARMALAGQEVRVELRKAETPAAP
jgi:hypothetical protein